MHQCAECGEVAAEPKLRYCEHCGARMPEFKPPALAVAEDGEGAGRLEDLAPARPPYTGPLWLKYVPAHSPTVLGIILHMAAIMISALPSLAGPGRFWSFVIAMGALLVVAREYRGSGEVNPLFDWVPESFQPTFVPAAYAALSVALCPPMLEFSIQPLLWVGGTVLVVRDQWGKVFTNPGGYREIFEPRLLVRGPRIMALGGIAVCLLSLLLTWHVEGEVKRAQAAPAQVRAVGPPRPTTDSVYGGTGGINVSGLELPVGSTVEIGLLALLVLLMLRPEADRPVWLRFVPIGLVVIALAWVVVNMEGRPGPIVFLAGLVPVGLIGVLQALGRDEAPYASDHAPAGAYDDPVSRSGALSEEDDILPPGMDDPANDEFSETQEDESMKG